MSHNDVISRRYLAPLQSIWRAAIVSGVAVVLSACQLESSSQTPVADDWSLPGGDSGKTFYSRLNQINTANVAQLGLAWEFDLETGRGQESTPVLLGDVLVTSSNLGRVYAVDARTGQERWRFVPTVDMQVNRTACCDQVNRGIAVSEGLIYVGALDGQLYVFGGRTRLSDGTEIDGTLASVERYDPGTDGWAMRAPMPTGRRTFATTTLHGRVQILGGEKTPNGQTYDAAEEYDPDTDSWRALTPMPDGRHGMAFGVIYGRIHTAGGGTTGGGSFSDLHQVLTVP